ncbi:hypothetical protein M3A49_01150 [Paraburkholderia sp. CNPSo 3076]|nr:hypothetical protein [Paraburkholderia sp. CNPSo 3076]MCX5538115.1 hypothetical protein [Paraburkholderia sp. CNPSo 3076]
MQQLFLSSLCLTLMYRLLARALKQDGTVFFVRAVLMLGAAALCK